MTNNIMTDLGWRNLSLKAGTAFSPSAPIDVETLFAGRMKQMQKTIDVCNQKGQHAIIFGERGVGKTSLSNILANKFYTLGDKATFGLLSPKVTCNAEDNYTSIWKRIFSQIEIAQKIQAPGFNEEPTNLKLGYAGQFGENISIDEVRQALMILSQNNVLILIIDEFDRVYDTKTKTAIADTIKTLSDNSVNTTVIIVGVADTIDELIEEHSSVERALLQIKMPQPRRLTILINQSIFIL